jgi:ABC-type Co2+ transport system permease subunit
VAVSVVHVGIVPMTVPERRVIMRMRVRLSAVPGHVMLMLVMRVMHMRVGVRQGFMAVFMLVTLAQMQPDTGGHQ